MSFVRSVVRRCRKVAYMTGVVGDASVPLRRRIERLLDTEAKELFDSTQIPGLAVIVRLPNASRVERYWGHADVASGRLIGPDTTFQVMSVSKPIVAMLCARLTQLGFLSLDEPVSSYLKSWTMPPERRNGFDFDRVTLRRILSHTAGLNIHGFGWTPPHLENGLHSVPARSLVDGALGEPLRLVNQPGSLLLYSGGGFALVEIVIEDIMGKPFAEVMREHLLEPLAVTRSSFEPTPEVIGSLATRYDASFTPQPRCVIASCGASGLYATAGDACTLWESMLPGRSPAREPAGRGVISPDLARELVSCQAKDPEDHTVGLGFYIWIRRSDVVFGHRGFKDGWWSDAEGFAHRRCVIIAFSNGDADERCVKTITTSLRQCLFDHAV